MKKVYTGGMAIVFMLILILLPAKVLAADTTTFEYDVDNTTNPNLSWDGDRDTLTLNVSGDVSDDIIFDLKGNSDVTVTICLNGDVSFSKITLNNQNGSFNYPANIRFISGDGQPYKVQVDELQGTGCDEEKLIIGSNINMSIRFISIGSSGGANSYLTLEDGATLTYGPLENSANDWEPFTIKNIEIGKNATLTSHFLLYDGNLPTEINFTSTEGAFVVTDVNPVGSAAIIFENSIAINDLPQWLQNLIAQNGWQLGTHVSLQTDQKTILDQDGKIVTSFTLLASNQNDTPVNSSGASEHDVVLLPVFTAPTAPQDVAVQAGEQGVMSVSAVNADSYQWYVNRNDGQGYVAIAGATGTTYTTSAVTLKNDGYTYYCKATNAYGTAQSQVFTLRVNQSIMMPQTGDDMPAGLWALLLSSLGCVSLLMLGRRRRSGER